MDEYDKQFEDFKETLKMRIDGCTKDHVKRLLDDPGATKCLIVSAINEEFGKLATAWFADHKKELTAKFHKILKRNIDDCLYEIADDCMIRLQNAL